MKSAFYSYLDGFNKITIIYPIYLLSAKQKKFLLLIEQQAIELVIDEVYSLDCEMKYVCSINETIALEKEYIIVDESNNRSILRSGAIVRTDLFEMLYYYNKSDLGCTYSNNETTFKVWSPVAHEIELELVDLNGNKTFKDFTPGNRGIWACSLTGDLEGYKYRYNVRVNDYFQTITDPYAISSNANGEYNYIVDLNKTYQFQYPKPAFSGRPVDAVIYEVHVRDFTVDNFLNLNNPGKFIGMFEDKKTPDGNPTGLDYLKFLGITHIQLLPIYDYGFVDERKPLEKYNWGYDPEQYNVPEGSYATDPDNPYARINELKMLVDEVHKRGMRVSMDVVYNHVYEANSFPLQILVPGYYFRYDHRGIMTNSCGCKNDVASDRKMVRKFILDSVTFWAQFYGISAFRFDLMGLIDIETMNSVAMVVKDIDSDSFIYGEGWNMSVGLPEKERANMNNHQLIPQIGFFNDKFRNFLRGDVWSKTRGYAMGGKGNLHDFIYLFTGSSIDNYLFGSPMQSLNYVECHDNNTFYDIGMHVLSDEDKKHLPDYCRLAIGIVMLSQGMPFLHAGQEVMRSKKGAENSYRDNDEINKISWADVDEYWSNVLMVKDLIAIRKEYPEFRYDKNSMIKQKVKYFDSQTVNACPKFTLTGVARAFYILIKNDYEVENVKFDSEQTLIFDGFSRVKKYITELELTVPGVYIIIRGKEQ